MIDLKPIKIRDIEESSLFKKDVIDFIKYADYIVLQSILHTPCIVTATLTRNEKQVEWFVYNEKEEKITEDIISCPTRIFRSTLARIGNYYMLGQLYYGFSMRTISYEKKLFRCSFYMGNEQLTGFWIKIIVREEPH